MMRTEVSSWSKNKRVNKAENHVIISCQLFLETRGVHFNMYSVLAVIEGFLAKSPQICLHGDKSDIIVQIGDLG